MFTFDEQKADNAEAFFEKCLTLYKGKWAGQAFRLLPWQRDEIVRPLFGTLREDGTRRYRRCYISVPKKQGKTHLAAGIALYLLLGDQEPGAEVYVIAPTRTQAKDLLFRTCKEFVLSDPILNKECEVYGESIYVPRTKSTLKLLTSKPKQGFDPSAVIFDEFGDVSRELWEAMTSGDVSRKQPLTVCITTAHYDRTSVCFDVDQHSRNVIADPNLDTELLPVIYGLEKEEDWNNEDNWKRALPSYGVTIDLPTIRAKHKQAQALPSEENIFRRFYLNQWVQQAVRWLPMDYWDKCTKPVEVEKGDTCYLGLDYAMSRDLTALIAVFPKDGDYQILADFWLPEGQLMNAKKRDGVDYFIWKRQGYLRTCDGDTTRWSDVHSRIMELSGEYKVKAVAFDRWGLDSIREDLENSGLTFVPCGQGIASMSAPSKELERAVLAQQIRHGNNPILRWCATNATVDTDAAGNIKPTKAKSYGRIDGIVATIMAIRAHQEAGSLQTLTSYDIEAMEEVVPQRKGLTSYDLE